MGSKDLQPIPDDQVPVTIDYILQQKGVLEGERLIIKSKVYQMDSDLAVIKHNLNCLDTVLKMCLDKPLEVPPGCSTAGLDLPDGILKSYEKSLYELRQELEIWEDTNYGRYIAGGSTAVAGAVSFFFPAFFPVGGLLSFFGLIIGALIGLENWGSRNPKMDLIRYVANNPSKREPFYEKIRAVQEPLEGIIRYLTERKNWIMDPNADLVPTALAVDSIHKKMQHYSGEVHKILDPAFEDAMTKYTHLSNKRQEEYGKMNMVTERLKRYQQGEKK